MNRNELCEKAQAALDEHGTVRHGGDEKIRDFLLNGLMLEDVEWADYNWDGDVLELEGDGEENPAIPRLLGEDADVRLEDGLSIVRTGDEGFFYVWIDTTRVSAETVKKYGIHCKIDDDEAAGEIEGALEVVGEWLPRLKFCEAISTK